MNVELSASQKHFKEMQEKGLVVSIPWESEKMKEFNKKMTQAKQDYFMREFVQVFQIK